MLKKLKVLFNKLLIGDNISSVEYDSTGCYLASGDQGGRIVIFKAMDVKNHLRSKEVLRNKLF